MSLLFDILDWVDRQERRPEAIDVEYEDLSETPPLIEQSIVVVETEDVYSREHKWEEYLTWCPSQIFYNFIDTLTNRPYQLYLRWRHSDPWTANLYLCKDFDYEGWSEEVMEFRNNLGDRDFNRLEYKTLEVHCLGILKNIFPHIEFKDPV